MWQNHTPQKLLILSFILAIATMAMGMTFRDTRSPEYTCTPAVVNVLDIGPYSAYTCPAPAGQTFCILRHGTGPYGVQVACTAF